MDVNARLAALLVAIALTAGCKTGAYLDAADRVRTRNPHAALEYVALCLAEDPRNEKALDLLDDIALRMGDEHKARIETLTKSGAFDQAVAECDRMIASARLVADLPGSRQVPVDESERARLAEQAAALLYERGVKLEATDRKAAAIAFRRTLGFVADYKDSKVRYDTNRGGATHRIAVNHVTARTDRGKPLAAALEVAFKKTILDRNPEFVMLLEPDAVSHATASLHPTLHGKVHDTGWTKREGHNTARVVARAPDGRPLVGQDGKPITRERSVDWTVFTRRTSFELSFAVDVKDLKTGAIIAAAAATTSGADESRYANFKGDDEVLPDEVKRLLHDRTEPRDPLDLSEAAAPKLAAQVALQMLEKLK